MGAGDWFLNNVGKATWGRWIPGAAAQNEGGVDVPLPSGTPIYALGTGKLEGAGNFTHANGNPGYGVVTEDVPGVGQVYYQHINIAPGIPFCKSGNCGGYTVHAGQLLGYSRNAGTAAHPAYESEVGINSTWGGIWGTNTNNALWVTDPRPQLISLAKQADGITPDFTTGPPVPTNNNPINTLCSQLPPSVAFVLCGIEPTASTVGNTLTQGTCAPWDIQCLLAAAGPLIQKLLIFTVGMVLLIIGFWLLATKAGEGVLNVAINGEGGSSGGKVETAKKAAEVAAL